ncbi:MAG: hypothetical protein HY876_01620 [Coriobacteriales bacterium]|nr:hypothetical protein [Coriobacteriales bacterium]
MRSLTRGIAFVMAAALVLVGPATALALTETHPLDGDPDLTPVSPAAITQYGSYRVNDTCVNVCHPVQRDSRNNNHGLYLRPITGTTTSVFSDNPYFPSMPSASFNFTPGDPDRASWVIGGLGIGAERYIYQGDSGGVNFPQIGDKQWMMDYANAIRPLRRGAFVPGYNRQTGAVTTAWADYNVGSTLNYFTGSSTLTPTASQYGCVNCHSYGARIVTDGGGIPTAYQVQEWGVTCVNCHGNDPEEAHDPDNPVPFNSNTCYRCHDRQPIEASPGVPARPQQLTMQVWDTGQAKNHRNQGFEVRNPKQGDEPESEDLFVPGSTEHTAGAGHPRSMDYISSTSNQWCYRCHSNMGWIAHTETGEDTPTEFTLPTGLGDEETYLVNKSTSTGIDCVACHTSHGGEVGLNQFGMRIPPEMSYDAGAPDDPAWRQCSDCHRARQRLGSGASATYSMLPYLGTFDFNATSLHGSVQREMFLGYGGYGVSYAEQTHLQAGVWCQYCHMPITTAQPEADSSHLFMIAWPDYTLSTTDVASVEYPAGASATDPVPKPAVAFPDDSCTGAGCHLPNTEQIREAGGDIDVAQDEVKSFLQTRATYWQTTIASLLAETETLLDEKAASSGTDAYKMARTNYRIVDGDKSFGVHNFNYAKSLLDWSIDTLEGIGEAAPTELALGASNTTPNYAASFTLTGNLTTSSVPLGSKVVTLQSSTDDTNWTDVATLGSLNGTYVYPVSGGLTSARYYRLVYEGETDAYLPSISPSVLVKPMASVGTPSASKSGTLSRNVSYTWSGILKPQYPAGSQTVRLRVAKQRSNGSWPAYGSGQICTNANSGSSTRFSRKLSFSSAGKWRVQAYLLETSKNSTIYSRPKVVTVK